MKVFMIGGTGLLGSETAKVLIERGHEVTSLARQPLPEGAVFPDKMKIEYGDYLKLTDEEIRNFMTGSDGFVFAAGVDERVEGTAPVYEMFKKYNIDPLKRLLTIAKECGVNHVSVCGSYFSYFAKTRPELELTKWHPYIRSRIDQENMAMSFAEEDFDVAVLELPYIFGTQPGRKPVWVILVEQIRPMKIATFYPRGGTAMLTARQTGQALAGALEYNKGGNCYPIGYYNMTWTDLLTIVHKYMGCPGKKIITIPDWMFLLAMKKIMKEQKKRNVEGGLHMVKFTPLQCSNLFIDKSLGCEKLHVEEDDIDEAIGDSVRLSLEVLDKKTKVKEMRVG